MALPDSKVELGRNPVLATQQDASGIETQKVVSMPFNPTLTIARSAFGANAITSVQLTGLTSTQLAGLTQVIVTGGGATSAVMTTLQISGLSSAQLGGASTVFFAYDVPAGALVPGPTLALTFDPPLMQNNIGTPITVQLPAFGTGNAGVSLYAAAKIIPTAG